MSNLIPLLVLSLTISACKSNKSPNQLWMYTEASGRLSSREENFSPVSFLSLADDGTYTSDFGDFSYGTWKIDADSLHLTNDRDYETVYQMSADEQNLRLTPNGVSYYSFKSLPLNRKDSSANPFIIEHNLWRIKPTIKENDDLLLKRLINHCKFWEVYFTWAHKNNLPSIDVRSLPTPIKIYSNGFELKPVTKKWMRYFYDKEDAFRANEILEDVIRNNKIEWTDTEVKFQMFVGAFQQMQAFLRNYARSTTHS